MTDLYDAAVEAIYSASVSPAEQPCAIAAAAECVGGYADSFQYSSSATGIVTGVGTPNVDPALCAVYFAHLQHHDPVQAGVLANVRRGVVSMWTVCDPDVFRKSPAWNDFYRRADLTDGIGLPVRLNGGFAFVALNCGGRKGRFQPSDIRTATRLGRHFQNAARVRERLALEPALTAQTARAALDALDMPLAIGSLDRCIRFLNRAADRAAADSGDIAVRGGRIHLAQPAADARLGALLAHARRHMRLHAECILLASAPPRMATLTILAGQHEASFGAFAGEPAFLLAAPTAPAANAIGLDLIGLTASEEAFARVFAEGASLDQIASRLGLSHETVRWRRKRISARTGAANQHQLAEILAWLAPPIRGEE